jgi:hypothetical protein
MKVKTDVKAGGIIAMIPLLIMNYLMFGKFFGIVG